MNRLRYILSRRWLVDVFCGERLTDFGIWLGGIGVEITENARNRLWRARSRNEGRHNQGGREC